MNFNDLSLLRAASVAALLLMPACGMLIDKDAIVIARLGDESFTRGDLFQLIRKMDDKDRPNIRNKGDLLRVLDQYVNLRVKREVSQELADSGEFECPRDAMRDPARERYFSRQGDDEQFRRNIWLMPLNPDQPITPLMEEYSLSWDALRILKEQIEVQVDKIVDEMCADQAIAFLAMRDVQQGRVPIDPEKIEREYNLRRDEFKKLEWTRFLAIRFPVQMPNARELAAEARRRLDQGETFDALVEDYLSRDPRFVMESEIENNPTLARFRGFWDQASGAEPGAIIGPAYMLKYQQVAVDANDQQQALVQPESYLLLRVLEHRPEEPMTLQEAQPLLLPDLLVSGKMDQIRDERGVEIFDDKLPDPSEFSSSSDGLISF